MAQDNPLSFAIIVSLMFGLFGCAIALIQRRMRRTLSRPQAS
jgi:di/tricarboxylate transporter